jgi:hypothetical protein
MGTANPKPIVFLAGIGHNGGPPLDPGADWRRFCWKKAHARAWKTPPREIALARLARARALGMTYREYTGCCSTGVCTCEKPRRGGAFSFMAAGC